MRYRTSRLTQPRGTTRCLRVGEPSTVLTGMRDGVQIRVIVDSQTGEIISGYPTNLPRNP